MKVLNPATVLACVSFVFLGFFAIPGLAETSSVGASTTGVGESKASQSGLIKNKKFEESQEITDAKLRADAGSLSKYSFKFNVSYYGPTLGDISAKDQPNPDGGVNPVETALTGSMGVRYRFDPRSSLSAGTGLRAVHPMHGMERFDVQTPFVSYDRTARIAGAQVRHSAGVSVTTISTYKEVGQTSSLSYDLSTVYDLGESRFALGFDAGASAFLYNREYRPSDKRAARGVVQFFPALKFNHSNKISFVTSTALTWLSPRSYRNETVLLPKLVSQRLGMGYAFSRNIYLFPYLTFFPSNLALDRTTVSLSTSFSLL